MELCGGEASWGGGGSGSMGMSPEESYIRIQLVNAVEQNKTLS